MTETAPTGPNSPSATLNCPHCHTEITYYDVSGSRITVAPHCHTYFKYENEDPPEILTSFSAVPTLVFPIGTEGYLSGQFVRVVSYMHKKEAGASYNWPEYMLLRPNGQYVQLAEYNGHWMVIEPTDESYEPFHAGGPAHFINTGSGTYRLYNKYQAEVLYAVGEFDWNILDDQTLTISEYIQPPLMLISEQNGGQQNWYAARYLPRQELATAFGLDLSTLPTPHGVGAIELADPDNRGGAVLSFTGMALLAVVVLQVLLLIIKPSNQLFQANYQVIQDSAGTVKPIISPSFEVNGPAAVNVVLRATIDNQWLALPIDLVNEQTGRGYEFTKTLEYYHGVESGESWTEGDKEDNAVLSRVPSGRYHLNIYPDNDPGQSMTFSVSVAENSVQFSNLFILFGLLAIYPIILYIRKSSHEINRWSNSDYADVKEDDN